MAGPTYGLPCIVMNLLTENTNSFKNYFVKVSIMLAVIISMVMMANVNADAAGSLKKPSLLGEKTYSTEYTHPNNKQTNTIKLHWKKVSNAVSYEVYIKGGQYSDWKKYKTVSGDNVTVTGLKRTTEYSFKIKAIGRNKESSDFSSVQKIKTSRINYNQAGWEAMCRIVYHEVGMINDPMWDKPIVYVSDCVVNRYAAAKYGNSKTWAPYYKHYNNIQDVIYKSGGFMSDAGLRRDGATYNRVPTKVKKAVWGAVYGKTYYNGIANDYKVYYWCNRSYKTNSPKIAYTFRIPWGYFNIWREYWG